MLETISNRIIPNDNRKSKILFSTFLFTGAASLALNLLSFGTLGTIFSIVSFGALVYSSFYKGRHVGCSK